MLTESEILDEQVQTLDEALDKLEQHSDEPITPNRVSDVDVGQSMDVSVECMKSLVDLYHTISIEGVSADDVKAIRHIRERMAPFLRLPSAPALEAYEGTFTPSRSMINQTISQEATLAEIGKTLKEWFFMIVDFIIRVAEWCRGVWNSETLVRARLRTIDSHLQVLYNAFEDALKRNAAAGRDMLPALLSISELVLSDPKLTRSPAMLVAFNKGTGGGEIKAADADVDRTFKLLMKEVSSLKSHIENNKPMPIGYDFAHDINVVADALEDMTVAVDDKDFFLDELGTDFWLMTKRFVTRPMFYPSHSIDQVQLLAKEFRGIKRNANFDQLKEVDILVQSVENITGCIKGLERIITFKQKLLGDYYKASATLANFYIRGREHMLDELRKNAKDDNDKLIIDRLDKAWADLMKRVGI